MYVCTSIKYLYGTFFPVYTQNLESKMIQWSIHFTWTYTYCLFNILFFFYTYFLLFFLLRQKSATSWRIRIKIDSLFTQIQINGIIGTSLQVTYTLVLRDTLSSTGLILGRSYYKYLLMLDPASINLDKPKRVIVFRLFYFLHGISFYISLVCIRSDSNWR